jgi:hypothetical protein
MYPFEVFGDSVPGTLAGLVEVIDV